MKKSKNDYRGHSKKLEAKNKTRAKAFAKKEAGRGKSGGRKKASPMTEAESGYITPRSGGASEKAYKLLAAQEGISNAKAKDLIDRGLVYVGNKKVMIARGELPLKTEFKVQQIEKIKPIFENDDLIVLDKPAFLNADEVERQFKGAQLLHRLDRETSGVLMLVKNEAFRQEAIEAFKNDDVYKEYVAWVEGIVTEEAVIDEPILTEKRQGKAHSKVSQKGKPAVTEIFPMEVSGKKSKLRLVIHHGRTHQIRTHLRFFGHSIIGDEQYGGRRSQRVMLHAKKVELLGYTFEAPEPTVFKHFSAS